MVLSACKALKGNTKSILICAKLVWRDQWAKSVRGVSKALEVEWMGYWHEPARHKGGWVFPNREGTVGAVFEGQDVQHSPFEGYFLRWKGEGETPVLGWRQNPENWIQLRPHQALPASSMNEARAKIAPLLPQIEAGSIDDQFESVPYQPPHRPHLVKKIEHTTHWARARIVQQAEGRYEVDYLVYAPDGKYFPAATPSIGELGWEWGRPRVETRTLADDLTSAEEIGGKELNQIVQSDPEIRRR